MIDPLRLPLSRLLPLLLLLLATLAPPAVAQAYDSPGLAARAAKFERDLRAKLLRANEKPQPATARQASAAAAALVRERKYAEAVPLLERAIVHGGGDHQVWLQLGLALGSKRPAEHELAAAAAHRAFKLASDNRSRAAALFQLGFWHEQLRDGETAIAAYEESLKLENSAQVRQRLTAAIMQYRHQVVSTAADNESAQPQLCLTFSKPLPADNPALFQQFIAVAPAIKAAFAVKDRTLCISGVAFGQSYRVTVRAGLPSTTPLKTTREESHTVAVPDRRPTVAFRGSGYILPKGSRQGIPLASVNVERAAIKVLRINDRNLIAELIEGRIRERFYDHEAKKVEESKGELVWTGSLRVQGERNKEVTTAIPFAEIVKDPKPGIYVVLARATRAPAAANGDDDEDGELATQWVVVTDLGVSTYSGPQGLAVYVRSYESAGPRAGVTVRLVARNNEILGAAVSDAAGRASFAAGLLRGQGGLRPAAILLQTEAGEFTFLDLVRPAFDLTDRGVGGRPAPGPIDGFVYAERGVYRPGETVHLTALLRDNNAAALGNQAAIVKLIRPDGVEAQRFTLAAAQAGGATVSVPLAKSAPTGAWRAALFIDPNGPPVGATTFQVEDFVPERMEMSLAAEPNTLEAGKPATLKIDGRFLYGAPAADLAVDAEVQIKLDPQPFPEHRAYRFGLAQESFEGLRQEPLSATTDARGQARLEIALDKREIAATRPLVADIRVTLNEEGGRSIERRLALPVKLRPFHIGLRLEGADDIGTVAEGTAAKFLAIAVDRAGQRVAAANLDFELVREVYEYQWYNQDGRWNYRAVRRDEPVQKGRLAIAAGAPAELNLTAGVGRYRLEVTDAATGAATSYRYSVGWTYAGDDGNEVPDKLSVTLDKPSYKAGETAKVSIRAPFDGVVHVVVAGEGILASRHEAVTKAGIVLDIPVDAAWGTGVYVLATAYRPNGKAERLGPTRAIGLAYLGRDTADRVLGVRIEAPESITPRGKVAVKLAIDGARNEPVFLTLAAVDEGILALTGYKTPAPDAHYFGKRRLALELRDDYGRLIDAYAGRLGEIRQGGDDRARHLGGLDTTSIQTVALFSGIVRADDKGEATVSLDVPDFNGRLRLMAVAWSASRLGKAEKPLVVRDPVVSTVTLPRFLAPGDRGRITVVLHNVDGPAGAYRVRLAASGAAAIAAPTEATVQLAKDQRVRLAFVLAGGQPGTASIQLAIAGPQGFAIARGFDIAVRPAQASTARFVTSQLDREGNFTLGARELAEYLPGTAALHLTVGTSPDLGIADLMRSLDTYPYGCAEQTTSRALPLLYLAEVARSLGIAKDDVELRSRVQAAIGRILAMQQRDGGFGLWSAADTGGGWLSAYIMDFLTQARTRGFTVPDIAFESGLNRLDALVRDLGHDAATLPTLVYAHYVLAANRRGDVAGLRYLHDTQLKEIPTALAKAQLAAALALFGDAARGKAALDAAKAHETRLAFTERGWQPLLNDYGSLLRDRAGVLHLASLAQPADPALGALVEAVRRTRGDNRWLSTQEQVWMVLAASALGANTGAYKANVAGREIAGTGKPFAGRFALGAGESFVVRNTGDDKIWVGATISGIPARDLAKESRGFEVTRVFYKLNGERADLAKVRQSEVLVALIRVTPSGDRPHQALIVDLLPAGFEIENPRLDRRDPEQMKWLPALAQARTIEPRDDRFVAAIDLWRQSKEVYFAYVVRAVTPGTFRLPAAFVEDMYAPAFHGRDAMGTVTILPRQ
jgi:hypothetical protein